AAREGAYRRAVGAPARRGQTDRGGRAEAAGADQQDLRAQQLALALLADLGQEEVAAVALDLLGAERLVLDHRQPGLGPLLKAALQVDHVLVAEVVQRLGGEHGPQAGLAVEDDRRLRVGRRRADAELEEAAADVGGRLDG